MLCTLIKTPAIIICLHLTWGKLSCVEEHGEITSTIGKGDVARMQTIAAAAAELHVWKPLAHTKKQQKCRWTGRYELT